MRNLDEEEMTAINQDQYEENLIQEDNHNRSRRALFGGICVVAVVLSWVALATISQVIQQGSHSSVAYDKPYFQTYILHSGYSFTIGIWAIWYFCVTIKKNPGMTTQHITARFLGVTFVFSVLSFVSGYLYYLSVPITPVSANTAIYQASSIFIFLFSIPILKERASLGKIFSVLCCVLGVCGVVFSSEGDEENGKVVTVGGYLFVIGSTIVYSLAETLYGKVVKGDRATSEKIDASYSFLFLGFIGLWTFVIFWPGMFLLHHLNVETFELPWGSALWGQVILLVLDTIFNAAFYVGIYFSSPLFMSVGSILTVPCSLITDKLVNDYHLSPLGFVGVFGIVLGFLGLNVCEYYSERLGNLPEGRRRRMLKWFVQDVTDFCKSDEHCAHKLE